MTSRRRLPQPWYRRYARQFLGAIAGLGATLTAYLTFVKVSGAEAICLAGSEPGTGGCGSVLNSAYAEVFGLPLPLFGCLAYTAVAVCALGPLAIDPEKQRRRRERLETISWWALLTMSLAMAAFSSYLMYVLATELQAFCPYCIASALFSASLLLGTVLGRDWEDFGQVAFIGSIVIVVTGVGALGIFAGARTPAAIAAAPATAGERQPIPPIATTPKPGYGWEITTSSGPAELALAEHLNRIGAREYGAYWCPHCYEQKQLFGAQAFGRLSYVECSRDAQSSQHELCQAKGVPSYPTWEIGGQLYSGTQTLEHLAELSGYRGSQNFRYRLH